MDSRFDNRPDALGFTLERLHERRSGSELRDALQVVAETAQALFDVAGVGLMFVDDERVLRYVTATDGPARELEEARRPRVWARAWTPSSTTG